MHATVAATASRNLLVGDDAVGEKRLLMLGDRLAREVRLLFGEEPVPTRPWASANVTKAANKAAARSVILTGNLEDVTCARIPRRQLA